MPKPLMPSVDEVREQVRSTGLLDGARPLVAMLSGGRDSVCLLDVLIAICGAERVHALHVNYGLRAGADEDERHCRELCRRLGAELQVVRAGDREGNLHAWARELRYSAAETLARRLEEDCVGEGHARACEEAGQERDISRLRVPHTRARARVCIATGHTSTDQVETILYRLAASPGRRALLGMEPHSGRLVRPLLDVSREQTAAYCRERGLAWREDPSNDDPSFARSRVRHGLLEALQAVHPAAALNVLRTADLLREESTCLEQLIDVELKGSEDLDVERLRALPMALQRLIVIHLAERAAGTFVPQAGRRVPELLALAERGGRGELHIGGLVSAVIEGGRLHMRRIQPREQRPRRDGDRAEPPEQRPRRDGRRAEPPEQRPRSDGPRAQPREQRPRRDGQ